MKHFTCSACAEPITPTDEMGTVVYDAVGPLRVEHAPCAGAQRTEQTRLALENFRKSPAHVLINFFRSRNWEPSALNDARPALEALQGVEN